MRFQKSAPPDTTQTQATQIATKSVIKAGCAPRDPPTISLLIHFAHLAWSATQMAM